MKQPLIAFDQLMNTLVWAKGEGFGMADETISARCWRLRHRRTWGLARRIVDRLFFWESDHCMDSYLMELVRHHLPPTYLTSGQSVPSSTVSAAVRGLDSSEI